MTHDNSYRPPLDVDHLWNQVAGVQQVINNEKRKTETDPTEEPRDLYEEEHS